MSGSAGPRHDRYLRTTTAYTSLLMLDEHTVRVTYDRLAHGWKGPPAPTEPPAPYGSHDRIFTMAVTITGGE